MKNRVVGVHTHDQNALEKISVTFPRLKITTAVHFTFEQSAPAGGEMQIQPAFQSGQRFGTMAE
jgi:hypothetical protein